ncbi:MAG: hypothetical protein HOY76_13495 [Streptomyces sp.]|nr:hypothetical protein [Streptomyces sp.]
MPSSVFRLAAGGRTEQLVVEQYPRPMDEQYECMLYEMTGSVVETADGMLLSAPGPVEIEASAQMAARGVRVRGMYPRALLAEPEKAARLRQVSDAGVSVRVLDHLPHDLLVFDGHTVCLTAGPAVDGEELPLVRVSGLLLASSFAAIYESYWQRATPLSRTSPGPHHAQLGDRERAVIRLMTNGYSDDRIARKLGITTPDVQSVMAALMERLDAGSRFEAGYKLAREVDPRDL